MAKSNAKEMGRLMDENKKLKDLAKSLLATCEQVRGWLSSFSIPPTSTIQEKQEHLAILDAAINKAKETP